MVTSCLPLVPVNEDGKFRSFSYVLKFIPTLALCGELNRRPGSMSPISLPKRFPIIIWHYIFFPQAHEEVNLLHEYM
jgi:hypothetical protein